MNAQIVDAARRGSLDAVKGALASGVDLNSQCSGNRSTALIAAAYRGHIDIVEFLLQQHADVNLSNDDGASAVDAADSGGFYDISLLLRSRGGRERRLSNTAAMLPDQCLNTKMLTFIRLRLTTAVQLACTLVLRFRRQNVLLVTGFHHSGTSVVQHFLARQRGVYAWHASSDQTRLPEQVPNPWQVLSLAMTAPKGTTLLFKCPSNKVRDVQHLRQTMCSYAARGQIIVCHRDASSCAYSLSRRFPDSDLRMHVLHFVLVSRAWRSVPDGCVHISLEDFSKAPTALGPLIHRVLEFAPGPGHCKVQRKNSRPSDLDHEDLRRWQVAQPVFPLEPSSWMLDADARDVEHIEEAVASVNRALGVL